MDALVYLFWPNPGNAFYTSPKVMVVIVFCTLLILVSFVCKWWRHREQDARRRTLSRSWSSALLWFGIVGLILIVARVEQIQFVAMRLWWVIWGLIGVFYIWFQVKNWRLRYYEVLPRDRQKDSREKYLPRQKHKR